MDIVDKLKSVGFDITIVTSEELLDFEIEKELYNIPHDIVFICTKK